MSVCYLGSVLALHTHWDLTVAVVADFVRHFLVKHQFIAKKDGSVWLY